MTVRVLIGDCREKLRELPDESVHCCVTSPPYFGLRDYGVGGQIGLEKSPDEFIAALVEVFREVHRVLRADGTLWLNLGDSYNAHPGQRKTTDSVGAKQETNAGSNSAPSRHVRGLAAKQLIGIPWRVAFALQADGWYLRSDIIWHKPNPMPESVTDRPTSAHEHIFLFAKSARYFFDADAVAEPLSESSIWRLSQDVDAQAGSSRANGGAKTNGPMKAVGKLKPHSKAYGRKVADETTDMAANGEAGAGFAPRQDGMRNIRNVWTVATQPFKEAHFATFPAALIEPCIKAGCLPGGVVFDPFFGAGTTGLVAQRLGRDCIGIELNPDYAAMAAERIRADAQSAQAVEGVPARFTAGPLFDGDAA